MGNYKYKAMKINGKRIDEHRRVAELAFGKEKVRGMVVHHKNGDKRDNRIENLELMTLSEHTRMHMTGHTASIESRKKQGMNRRKSLLKKGSRRNEKEVCEHMPKRKTHGGFRWMFLSEYKSSLETCDNGIRAAC